MRFEWTSRKIGEIFELVNGYAFKSGDFISSGIPVLKIKNVKPNNVVLDDLSYVSIEVASRRSDKVIRRGDILITMSGNRFDGSKDTWVGKVAHFDISGHYMLNQRVGVLRPREGVVIDRKCAAYFLSSDDYQKLFISIATSSGGQANLSPTQILGEQLHLPPIEEQIRISELLGALDDRISLLRETNATLESIAQALFKSWFVDFDPVRAKAEGRQPEGMDATTAALFPDSFEESELGLVPKGWRVMPLRDICSVTIGGLWGNDDSDDSDLVPAISLRGVDLEHLRANGFSRDAPVRWVKPTAMEKRRLSDKEVLVAASGAGPCGRPLWAGAPFEVIYGRPVIFSNFVKRLDCGSSARAVYVDRLLAEMRESSEIWNFINGTSVPNLDDKLLLSTKRIVLPPDEVLSKFFDIAKTIYDRLYDQKAQTLTQLRDTLLPRLISGQLRLPEAEALIEEAV